jgi:hypothetical protein
MDLPVNFVGHGHQTALQVVQRSENEFEFPVKRPGQQMQRLGRTFQFLFQQFPKLEHFRTIC